MGDIINIKEAKTESEKIVDRLTMLVAQAFDDGYIAGQRNVIQVAVNKMNIILPVAPAKPTFQWTNEKAKELVLEAFKPEVENKKGIVATHEIICIKCGMKLPPMERGEGKLCQSGYLCRSCFFDSNEECLPEVTD